MARGVSYELTGLRGFEADLAGMSQAIHDRAAKETAAAAFAIQRRAQANAPKDRGDLMRAIQVQIGRDGSARVGLTDGDIPSRGGTNTAHRNPWVYGVWYEYGFVTRRIAAHPFVGPAVEAEVPIYEQRLAQIVDGALLGRAA